MVQLLVGEGIGYPLQCSWASLVAQLVKNLPAMWENWVWSWVGKIPWRREQLPIPVFWSGEFHGLYSPWSQKESDTTEWLSFHFTSSLPYTPSKEFYPSTPPIYDVLIPESQFKESVSWSHFRYQLMYQSSSQQKKDLGWAFIYRVTDNKSLSGVKGDHHK